MLPVETALQALPAAEEESQLTPGAGLRDYRRSAFRARRRIIRLLALTVAAPTAA
jgi:hypothetical protein